MVSDFNKRVTREKNPPLLYLCRRLSYGIQRSTTQVEYKFFGLFQQKMQTSEAEDKSTIIPDTVIRMNYAKPGLAGDTAMKIICAYPVNIDAVYNVRGEEISPFTQSGPPRR